jgi:hypothetical protein
MRRLTFDDLAAWCRRSGYILHEWLPSIPNASSQITHAVPNDVQKVPMFLDMLLNLESRQAERLVWIRDWTIWDDRSQQIGLRHLEMLTGIAPNERELAAECHAYTMEDAELREAHALLSVAVLFGWDAHLFFASGETLVNFSHHGDVTVSATASSSARVDVLRAW